MGNIGFRHFGLSEKMLQVLEKLGYENPSQVQEKVIPLALEDKDIIVKSQTGSGKTASFAIPICERIELENNKPQVLVLSPTRELAVQIKEDISNIGRFKKIRCTAVFGKQAMEVQLRELRQRIHVIVGTPGRTLDHIENKNADMSEIKYLIIDEADKMMDMGFIDQIEAIIKTLPHDRVTMLFSATMPERIEALCEKYMINPYKIEVTPESLITENIQQVYYEIEEDRKFNLLQNIIYVENPESGIIFCNTKEAVHGLTQKMKSRGFSCYGLHGGMEQEDRLDTMKSFKKGEFQFLIATDVAARGTHIEEITHVINYDVPVEKESYVHRIGRTGRAASKGKAITLVSTRESRLLSGIEEYIGLELIRVELPSEEEILHGKARFETKTKADQKKKIDRSAALNKEITKIYINAGRKKKVRAGDIVGAITNIEGVSADDIGIIDVQDNISYVDILYGKGSLVLRSLQDTTIKGKKVKVQKAIK
ncbi:MAG: DEAD/DEAH box helicase [Bacillota bacterium]